MHPLDARAALRQPAAMSEGDSIGTIATGALIASEVERAERGAPAHGHDENEPCANCGQERIGPYCHACGQVGHVHRNVGALVHDIAHGVFHFEGKIWRTLPLLIRRPGELTRRYVAGERAKFVSPVALFLFSVFLMFALFNTSKHKDAAKYQATTTQELKQAEAELGTLRRRQQAATTQAEREAISDKVIDQATEVGVLRRLAAAGVGTNPEAKVSGNGAERGNFNTGLEWFDAMTKGASKNPDLLAYKLKTYAYKYSWALVPISVPFIWLLFFWRRDVGLYDHAIFAIYSLSFMSLGVVALVLLGKAGVSSAIIALAAMLIPPVHMYKQMKGAYGLSRFGAILRTFLLLIFTAITLTLFAAFVFYLGAG
jgi:hypothetical protein